MQEQELGVGAPTAPENGQTANSLTLYSVARECLFAGTSLVPRGDDPEYGCAISVNMLSLRAFGSQIGGGTSTYLLLQDLINSPLFQEVSEEESQAGDIIIDATGTNTLGEGTDPAAIPNGHVGILGYQGIMSNDSDDGIWKEKYTRTSWKQRYETEGGYPTRYFRRK